MVAHTLRKVESSLCFDSLAPMNPMPDFVQMFMNVKWQNEKDTQVYIKKIRCASMFILIFKMMNLDAIIPHEIIKTFTRSDACEYSETK